MENGHVGIIEVQAAARSLMGGFSLEVTPREMGKLGEVAEVLAPRTPVYITFLQNVALAQVVDAAKQVHEHGLRPVVHVAVRAIPDLSAMDRLLGELMEVGVTDLLLVAGSIASPAGSLDNTFQVLESDCLQRRDFASIGVAGHPEGNPGVDAATVDDAIARKNKLATEYGLPLHVVTQFCFTSDAIVEWERRMRESGNKLPVHVGFPGLTSPAKLLKFGLSCGIGPSLAVLRKQSGNVFKLATQVYRPTETLLGVARAAAADDESLLSAVHFFPFGAVRSTAVWANAIRDGRFEIHDDGRLVTTED
jgi:methylenetetrahydrofolate reductase (NADPH)